MKLGIVGSEQAKFTKETERQAREYIRELFSTRNPELVVSGGCHLGGVDRYAIEESKEYGIPYIEHLPARRTWSGGYRERNIKIAEDSDMVVCITVKELPSDYVRKGWEDYCYHCGTKEHIKSGGCWTTKYARKLGKEGYTLAV